MSADPTTQSNYLSISTDHVAFDWAIDFSSKTISGSTTHTLQVNKDGVGEVMSVPRVITRIAYSYFIVLIHPILPFLVWSLMERQLR